MDDEKIIQLFFSRDEEAIVQTDIVYGKRLKNFAYNILCNTEDAEECVNDTYLRLWNAIPPQKPNKYFAFILRICRNLALDKLVWYGAKKRNHPVSDIGEELWESIPDERSGINVDSMIIPQVINKFLDGETEENRFIFVRRYFYLDSIEKISSYTSLRASTVKTRLYRMREKLKTQLQKEGIKI